MSAIKRILVPLDLHRVSEAKMPVAAEQARAFGAVLILLHVSAPAGAAADAVSPTEARARAYLDAIAGRLHGEGITALPHIRFGSPVDAILEEIVAQRVDMVILGSTVRQGLSRLRLGSVAEDIVAKAPCPVLLVRPPRGRVPEAPEVRSFAEDAARAGPVAPRELGIRVVEIARIIGSVGRADQLDGSFRSRTSRREDDQRLARLAPLMQEGDLLPPVDLYKLGYGYYVLDGNHRVAAAKEVGQLDIEAHVTEFIPLGDMDAQRAAAERRTFERVTGLKRIGATAPGRYPQLEQVIRAFAEEHGLTDLSEAARRWENSVYRPIAQTIRKRRLTRAYPGERTADVFVRVAQARDAMRRAESHEVAWDDALRRLQDTALGKNRSGN